MVISPQFESASFFSEGLASASTGGKTGFIDKTGKYVINPQFDSASFFVDGLAQVGIKGKDDKWAWGYIDKSGKYVFGPANPD